MKRKIDKNGYVLVFRPEHPYCDSMGFIREHRLKIEKTFKRFLLKTEIVDHINGDTSDNRLSNLRVCTHKENTRNRILKSKNNKSGFKGVSFDKSRGKWQASIKVDYKSIGLGRFDNIKDAAGAYNKYAKLHFGEFAKLNII